MRPCSAQMLSSISRIIAPSRLSIRIAFRIILTRSAGLSSPLEERESGSRYDGIPLLMSLTTLPACTAVSSRLRVISLGIPNLIFMVEQIRSSPGRCFCPLILRMAERRFWTISSSRSPEASAGEEREGTLCLCRPRGILTGNKGCVHGEVFSN